MMHIKWYEVLVQEKLLRMSAEAMADRKVRKRTISICTMATRLSCIVCSHSQRRSYCCSHISPVLSSVGQPITASCVTFAARLRTPYSGVDIMCNSQGPAAVVSAKERGAGDWQLYQSPAAVLKEVAARNAQARLPGPPAMQQARSLLWPDC